MQILLLAISGKILAILVGLFYYKKLPLAYKLILLQVLLALVTECYGYYLTEIGISNIWLFNIYIILEVILLGIVALMLIHNKYYKTISFLILTSLILYGISFVYHNGMVLLANNFYLLSCGILVLLYLVIMFNHVLFKNSSIIAQPIFWLCLSTIIFFGCYLPYNGLEDYLLRSSPDIAHDLFLNINLALNFIRYPLVALAFYLHGRQVKEKLNTV